MIYVNTSALAAYYCPEPLSGKAQLALQEAGQLAISPLVELELASAIARKVGTREMRRADAHRILAVVQSHLERGIYTRLGIDAQHFARAREWIASLEIPLLTLDALHLAVAAANGCSLITADAMLAKACAKVDVAARLIS